MIKILILIIGVLVVCITIMGVAIHFLKEEIKDNRKTTQSVIDANKRLHDEIKRLNDVDKIKSDNRREANERIQNLYDGDAIDNAINILRNNKNS